MSIETKSVKDALEILKALCVDWVTVNKIENSLWETGLAFFDRSYCRVAYYDEVNHVLSINYEELFQVRTKIFAKESPIKRLESKSFKCKARESLGMRRI